MKQDAWAPVPYTQWSETQLHAGGWPHLGCKVHDGVHVLQGQDHREQVLRAARATGRGVVAATEHPYCIIIVLLLYCLGLLTPL